MRRPTEIEFNVFDPFVEGIGNIEYHPQSQAIVVSGYTDFSVWNCRHNNEAVLWSHSLPGSTTLQNENAFSTSAVFYDEDTVVASDSQGNLGVYIQKFS